MNAKPYIGVTGVASCDEVESIIQTFIKVGYSMETPHIPMLGFLVSSQNLAKPGAPFGNRYPRFDDVTNLLEHVKNRALPMIHYEPASPLSFASEAIHIFESTGIYDSGLCRAIQLNMPWPDEAQVRAIKKKFPDMQIVLQLRREMMQGMPVQAIVGKINKKYGEYLSYVLIDPSAGEGIEFDVAESTTFYHGLKKQLPDLTVGFAGGLAGNDSEEKLRKIVKELSGQSDFCIDSESGFRDKQTDTLEIARVRRHLQEVSRVLK